MFGYNPVTGSVPWRSEGFGGGSSSSRGGGGGLGAGGVLFLHAGRATIVNSTLTANTAQGGDGGSTQVGDDGGGLGLGGAVFILDGTVRVTNSTLSHNTVATGRAQSMRRAAGGSLFVIVRSEAKATLENSIFSDTSGGSDVEADTSRLQPPNTAIVLDASAPNLIQSWPYGRPPMGGAPGVRLGGVLLETMAQLEGLQGSDGLTPTRRLGPSSPARCAGAGGICATPPVGGKDQLGRMRGTTQCSLGAVEDASSCRDPQMSTDLGVDLGGGNKPPDCTCSFHRRSPGAGAGPTLGLFGLGGLVALLRRRVVRRRRS
jgi:MYXO-CTERM domain-containing protein